MFIQPNSPFQALHSGFHAPQVQQAPSMVGAFFQLALMQQMLDLMMLVMAMAAGSSPMSAGMPSFGNPSGGFGGAPGGGFGGASPAAFLGGSAGGAAPAGSSAATGEIGGSSAGGGWIKPVDNYRVSSRYGPRRAPTAGASTNHRGIDLAAPLNTPIRAAKGGVVSISKDERTGYGKWIEIKHDDGTRSRYAHLNTRDVQVGARVQAGQVIGKMGSTGTSTGSHLHFEILNQQGQKVNPESVMRL